MKLAIASGKGGAGKTFLSVNLAWSAPGRVRLLDCDVEAPNAGLLIRPTPRSLHPVEVSVPELDSELCIACGICAQICQFHAIAVLGREPLTFVELCHSCGGCIHACPTGALSEIGREVGVVEIGETDGRMVVTGRLHVGEAQSPPVIRAVKRWAEGEGDTVIDCPPGASCSLVTAVAGSDFVLLVAEPTPFGAHDLEIAVNAVRRMGLPLGIVVNRVAARRHPVHRLCEELQVPVLAEIAEDRAIRRACAEGKIAVETMPALRAKFEELWDDIAARAGSCAIPDNGGAQHVLLGA